MRDARREGGLQKCQRLDIVQHISNHLSLCYLGIMKVTEFFISLEKFVPFSSFSSSEFKFGLTFMQASSIPVPFFKVKSREAVHLHLSAPKKFQIPYSKRALFSLSVAHYDHIG